MVAENFINQAESTHRSNHFLYFSYGSNLLKERLNVQIKDAVFVCVGVLSGYQLVFFDWSHRWQGALGSIEQNMDSYVWGCVWYVPNSFADELDRQETGYNRLTVDVEIQSCKCHINSKKLVCRTYQYANEQRISGCPSPHYKNVILAGAIGCLLPPLLFNRSLPPLHPIEHKLPMEYIEWIRKIPTNGYKGVVQLKLKAIRDLNEEEAQES